MTSRWRGFLRGIDTAYNRVQAQGEHILQEKGQLLEVVQAGVWQGQPSGRLSSSATSSKCYARPITKQMEHALGLLEGELKNVWTTMHEKLQLNFGDEARKQLGAGMPEFNDQRKRLIERIDVALGGEHGGLRDREAVGKPVRRCRDVGAAAGGRGGGGRVC